MLSRKIIESQQLLSILSKASRGLWKFQLVAGDELVKGPISALVGLGHPDLMECLFLALGCTTFGRQLSMLPVLCTHQRCWRVFPYTLARAFQKPKAPSPIASLGSMVSPLECRSLNSSHQDCSLSRYPSSTEISSFFPSARAPMSTSKHSRASSKRTLQYMPSAQT